MKITFLLLSFAPFFLTACSVQTSTEADGGNDAAVEAQNEHTETADERREREGRLWRERQKDYYHQHNH